MSSSISHAASAITKTMSTRMSAHRGIPLGETHAWSEVAPSETSRSLDEGKGISDPDEQNRSNPSTASHRLASPPENVITKEESYSPPQPGSGPHLLQRSKSRAQEHEGVGSKAMRAPEPPISEKERKRTTASEEHELQETSATDPCDPRRKAEPTPPSRYTRHDKRYPQTPPENSIERTYSSFSRESDSGYASLPDADKSRGNAGSPSDSASSLAGTGSSITPPPTSFSARSQPKHITRVSSTKFSAISSADHRPRPPSVAGDSQIQTAPSISPSTSSRAPAPATSQMAHRDGGTPPGPIKPSNSMRPEGQPHAATVTPGSQDGPPNMRTLPQTGGDASSRLPGGDGGDSGQTRIPSRLQLNPTYEMGGHSPLGGGYVQPSGE